MKLIVCSRDIDATLVKGDLISWHEDDEFEGKDVGLFNALSQGSYSDATEYLTKTPFIILILPRVSLEDIRPVFEDVMSLGKNDGEDGEVRKWKIDTSRLEKRTVNSVYADNDNTPTKTRWMKIVPSPVRRDTLNAYREITRNDIIINQIMVSR